VRMRAIAGKNLPPSDAGEGVGAGVRAFLDGFVASSLVA